MLFKFIKFIFICLLCLLSVQCYLNSVTNIDLMRAWNAPRHQTSMFYSTKNPLKILIIRRCEKFQFRIHLKTPFYSVDRLQLHFHFETSRGVYNVYIPSKPNSKWRTNFFLRANVIEVEVHLPANVPVGFWNLYIYTYRNNNVNVFNAYAVRDILVLFNPWSSCDSVYYPNTSELSEYILNEQGFTVAGDLTEADRQYWIYGQFKPTTVVGLKLVLSKLPLTPSQRADPVSVSRALSAIVNYHDDNGIMVGKWFPPYDQIIINNIVYRAQSPFSWTGTPEILDEYIRTKGRTMGFAQCWVFASLLVTFGRALGIASRTITNFDSGHDSDGNITISFIFNQSNELVRQYSESIWNFHVWTEMWMNRYDLSNDGWKYGGWQYIDGTPQIPSNDTPERFYQIGPASRKAIKMSQVLSKYDTRFAYAAVNADIIYRNYLNIVTDYFRNSVGRLILTKGFGNNIVDITTHYKEREGTLAERQSFIRALGMIYNLPVIFGGGSRSVTLVNDTVVMIKNLTPTKIGSVLNFLVTVRNNYKKARNLDVSIDVYSLYYNGVRGNNILKDQYLLKLDALTENIRRYEIEPKDYIYKLVPFSIVRIEICVRRGQNNVFKQIYDLKIKKPTLIIKPNGRAIVNKLFNVDVQLINPLQIPLTNCVFAIQGIRLNADVHKVSSVKPFENKIYRFALVFEEAIRETVIFSLTTNELYQVQGQIHVDVHNA